MSLVGRNRRVRRRDIQRIVWTTLGGLLASGTLVAAHSFTLVRDSLRQEECNWLTLGQNTRIYDRNQKLLSTVASNENREPIPLQKMSKYLIDATVSIEDKRFYEHQGLDYERIGGSFINEISNDGGRQGGSTLTMQLMKNMCHPQEERTWSNKLSEAYLASQYEETHSKDEILKQYLNSAFLGNNAVGVQAAARRYFNRTAETITLPQAALLAGLLQAPTTYDPFANPEAARVRRNLVLTEMEKDGKITRAQANSARRASLGLKRGSYYGHKIEGFFVNYITAHMRKSMSADRVKNGGYRVYTSINPRLQSTAKNAMLKVLRDEYGDSHPDAALAMLDVNTGQVLALKSTQTYGESKTIGDFDIASQGLRQAGSTFKTFTLTTALDKGYSPGMTYYSVSGLKIPGSTCEGKGIGNHDGVRTFSGSNGGSRNLTTATTSSDNSVYAQLTCDVGPQNVYAMAKKMGITSLDPTDQYNISLGLGGLKYGVSVLDMARAYAPLANGGYRIDPLPITRLTPASGKSRVFKPKRKKILSDAVTAEVTRILQANVAGGTGTRAQLPNVPAAGKTGTTDAATDVWFVGYTPKYVTAVWVGYAESRISMGNQQGGRAPATIWGEFMREVTKNESNQSFPKPKESLNPTVSSTYWTSHGAALAKPPEPETPEPSSDDEAAPDTDDAGAATDAGGTTAPAAPETPDAATTP